MRFLRCDEHQPEKSGYYMTWYIHPRERKAFLKGIYWEYGQGWVPWNQKFRPKVVGFLEESRSDYYTQCLEWYNNNESLMERWPRG